MIQEQFRSDSGTIRERFRSISERWRGDAGKMTGMRHTHFTGRSRGLVAMAKGIWKNPEAKIGIDVDNYFLG